MFRVVYIITLISVIISSKGVFASFPYGGTTIEDKISYSDSIKCRLDAINLMINKDVKQAIILAKEVLNEVEIINDGQLIAQSNLTIGKGYNYLGANAEALEYLSKALNTFRILNDEIQIAYTLREIGNIYYRQGEYASALNYFRDVLSCGNTLNDTSLLILALIGKGSVYGNTNRLDSAMIIFEETFQLSKRINDKSTEVHSLFNIGDVYRFTNRPNKPLRCLKGLRKNTMWLKQIPEFFPAYIILWRTFIYRSTRQSKQGSIPAKCGNHFKNSPGTIIRRAIIYYPFRLILWKKSLSQQFITI